MKPPAEPGPLYGDVPWTVGLCFFALANAPMAVLLIVKWLT